MEGWLSHSWAYQINVWYSPLRRSLPFWGALTLPAICLRKSGSPQDGCAGKPPRVRRVIPSQVGRKYRQGGSGSPLSIFPRGHSPVPPIRVQAASPVRRKPRDPWGSGWPRLGPSRGESGPWANPMKNLRIASQVIIFDIEVHVGENNDVRKGSCACSTSTLRMREVERKKQKGESNHGLRICRQWFRQLGHGLIVVHLRSNETCHFYYYYVTSPWTSNSWILISKLNLRVVSLQLWDLFIFQVKKINKSRGRRCWTHGVSLSWLGCYHYTAMVTSKPAREIMYYLFFRNIGEYKGESAKASKENKFPVWGFWIIWNMWPNVNGRVKTSGGRIEEKRRKCANFISNFCATSSSSNRRTPGSENNKT